MQFDPNDPRLTAYVLGELNDAERTEIETLLAKDEAARREVETLRQFTATLGDDLKEETAPLLSRDQRQTVLARAERAPVRARLLGVPSWGWVALGLATCLVIIAATLTASRRAEQQLAANREGTGWNPSLQRHAPKVVAGPPPNPVTVAPAPANRQTVTVGVPEPSAVGSTIQPGDHVDVLATYRDPVTNQETTQMILQNVTSSGTIRNAEGTPVVELQVSKAERERLTDSDRAGALRLMLRPPEESGVVALSGARMTEIARGHFEVSPQSAADSISGYDRWGNAPPSVDQQGVTIYRGQQAMEVPSGPARRGTKWRANRESGGNMVYLDGRSQFHTKAPYQVGTGSSSPDVNTETYAHVPENGFQLVTDQPLSTFSLDVDTASYANVRRFLNQNQQPPPDAVRIEELLNYFTYRYPTPRSGEPFGIRVEVAECPWNPAHRLACIGIKAQEVTARTRPAMNLVFLIDVSGSMQPENKLPLIKKALWGLTQQLTEADRVGIVVYATESQVLLQSTRGTDRDTIYAALDKLEANGSTNGGAGIQNAYRMAREHFVRGGVNRVILCTDGDFNVGVTDDNELVRLIQQEAQSNVFLTVFGFGMDNLKDAKLEKLADRGNGNYAYVDSLEEARKIFTEKLTGTLVTVAKDVKAQVEFNPAVAQAYRLIGYENRALAARDFNDDRKDAGDLGAGHFVTVLYEIVPVGTVRDGVDPLKYQADEPAARPRGSAELLTLKLRYKPPTSETSQRIEMPVKDGHRRLSDASEDFRFATAVAGFGMLLRHSPHSEDLSYEEVRNLAASALGLDANGERTEFLDLVEKARQLTGQ